MSESIYKDLSENILRLEKENIGKLAAYEERILKLEKKLEECLERLGKMEESHRAEQFIASEETVSVGESFDFRNDSSDMADLPDDTADSADGLSGLPAEEPAVVHDAPVNERQKPYFVQHTLFESFSDKEDFLKDTPGTPVERISHGVTINDKIQYINELFGEDSDLYRKTVEILDGMHSFSEALEYLRTNFGNWDESDDVVYRFYMTVRRKLRN